MIRKRIECISCQNESCLIKKFCHDEVAQKFLKKKNTIPCRKTQNIIIEGAPIHGIFFVYSGKVKVLNTGINGREQILRFAKDGEMLGQRGFSTHQYYPIGAVALEDTVLCNFSTNDMRKMLQEIPQMAYDFMVFYADELNRSETKVRKFAHMTVREKVIDSLLYINRKFGQKKGYLSIRLSRKEIADFAGTTEEQVIRVISVLKKDGLIISDAKKLGIPSTDILKQEIDEHHYFIQS
ncbi:Crp/Fnr family transcriptional regulator [Sunxiuqinia indica]|uniref:Crp/Fnr family transcriptional regulator n=1 Tax=Sunxiuqinia indica TaxID=2692584 RepID=UPI00135BA84D|nr:Crp/Fnr family transcriptional regulator [Sunxiuqinia indica]